MIERKAEFSNSDVINSISRFLASPPEGTPAEIIEAFITPGMQEYLPPKLFFETVEQSPVAISITDPTAKILYINKAFERLTGYRSQEIVGKNQSVLSCKATPANVYENLWSTIQDRRVWQGHIVNHRKDNKAYLAKLIVSPVLNAQGEITYFLGMHHDITDVHQLEQRLKFQKGLTEAAIDSAPMVVAMVAENGKVLFDNHAYKALMGEFDIAEPVNLLLAALRQQIGFDLGKINESDKAFTNIDIRLDSPASASGRWFVCSGVRIEKPNVTANDYFKEKAQSRYSLLLIANEVTASRQRTIEARLNMIRANMAEQQMLQTTREAISGAIYKLQVPLNIIKAALAMPGLGNEESMRMVLRQALDSGDEAMDSLHAALPHPAVEEKSNVNINEILHDVLKLFTQKLLATGVVVDWRPSAVLPTMKGRANELRGLFKYVLDNAIQATDEQNQSYREIRIETHEDQQELIIDIMDNGPGIPAFLRLKVFEPFYCGWAQPKGHAGMGLTMAQEIALGHGGSLEIDEHFYGGCRLFVRLPVDCDGGG